MAIAQLPAKLIEISQYKHKCNSNYIKHGAYMASIIIHGITYLIF